MAVTKIWPVKDSIGRLIDYAKNPDKTAFENLETVMAYAENEDKVIFEEGETCYLVTALNCRGDPLESMMKVQKHFGAKGENLAYHAYQSFKPGEVTAKECHEIGVRLAERLWGNRYQILVATHTNCSHMHNHFVVSSVSFRSGKKLDTGNNYWKRVLAPASDAICREYGLSTLGKRGKAAPRVLYMEEKKGRKTPYRLMFDALKSALNLATSDGDLKKYLFDMGYELDIRKAKIKSRFSEKWVNLKTLADTFGEGCMPSDFEYFYESNESEYEKGRLGCERTYNLEMKRRREANGIYRVQDWRVRGSLDPYPGELNTTAKILGVFMILLGWNVPKSILTGKKTSYTPLSPEMKAYLRDERKQCEMLSKTADIMGRENLHTGEDAMNYLEKIDTKLLALVKERKQLYYQAGRQENGDGKLLLLTQIGLVNEQLKTCRYEKKCIFNLLERSGIMKEMIENEMLMRREKREREYKKEEPVFEMSHEWQSDKREDGRRYSPPINPGRKSSDWER